MRRSIRVFASSVLAGVLLAPGAALAQDRAAAEELFQLGKAAMAKKDYAQACDYFKGSLNADFALGTLLNLAICHEQSGKIASAWADYRALEDRARRANQKDRMEYGHAHAEALRPRLSRIRIVVAPDTKGAAELVVKIDDVAVQPELFEAGMPVDIGKHNIVATATGRVSSSQVVSVDEEKAKVDATISLKALPPEATVAPPVAPVAPIAPPPPADSGQRTLGLVVGGVGGASLLTGIVFGILAAGASGEANCAAPCLVGSPELANAKDAYGRANTFGWVSNITIGIGALGLAAGAYLFFTAGPNTKKSARIGLSPGGLTIGGTL